ITTKDPWGDAATTETTTAGNSSLAEPTSTHTFSILDIDKQKTIEENFLGSSNAKLVNLDALMGLNLGTTTNSQAGASPNPFAMTTHNNNNNANKQSSNPFNTNSTPQPSL
ncbi:hypothetical protein, partial [Salmonella sp. s54836]|uniref:hypothetical protein n=1 Tax=Salmonella sp. s54836 TaxID=3159673 RepID=UPI00397EAEF6